MINEKCSLIASTWLELSGLGSWVGSTPHFQFCKQNDVWYRSQLLHASNTELIIGVTLLIIDQRHFAFNYTVPRKKVAP